MRQFLRGLSLWIVIFIILGWLFTRFGQEASRVELSYSEFKSAIKQGQVKDCVIREDLITGKYTDNTGKMSNFKTIPFPNDQHLLEQLDQFQVKYRIEQERGWLANAIWYFGPVVLLVAFWLFMVRQVQGGGKQAIAFGRTKARMQNPKTKPKVTFADVAGCDEAKEELKEIIEFLKDPKKFEKLGGKIPKGVLLYGAPGTGKTLLAKAVAGEAGVPFFSSSGSEFVEMFVGVGASRVRDLFEQGKKHAPSLLFIDELDAVGRQRFAGIGGGHDEREQTLNQLLVEMDGFDTRGGVILIAATNRPDVLDPALLRPGRFDRHIMIPSPDLVGREGILKVHIRNIKLSPEVDLNLVARSTPGFVGSDLANLVNEAALLAARRNKETVEKEELDEAVERVMAGPQRKSRMISEKEKKIISYHECGHALVAKLIPDSDPVHKISIIPRGPALGYTLQLPTEDRYLTSKNEILDKITVFLSGRVAEEMVFTEITTGAQNDLEKATELAHKMVCEFGMSEKLGPITFRKKEEMIFLGRDITKEKDYSEKIAEDIDGEVGRIMAECYKRAKGFLETNRDKLDNLANVLAEKEILLAEEIENILGMKGNSHGGAQENSQSNPTSA